jgi:S1-C subfamily serine protease
MNNNSEVSKLNGLSTTKGVVVTGIINGGNAERSELKTRDIILGVGQKSVNSTSELQAELAIHKPGDYIKLNIMRGEEMKVLDILLD